MGRFTRHAMLKPQNLRSIGGLILPTRQGKCIDFGGCTLADKREMIQIPDGAEFVCPECGRALSVAKGESTYGGGPWKLIGGLLALLVLAGVGLYWLFSGHSTKPTKPTPGLGAGKTAPTGQVILRLCGSNTIGSELAPAMAAAFLKAQGATDARIVPGPKQNEKGVQGTLGTAPSVIQVQAHGTTTAFAGLADDSCDIGMASRKIKPDEITQLASLGDMTSPTNEYLLGLDGIAVIVNKSNGLDSITKDQLGKIFSGQIGDWTTAGGGGGAIQLYVRDDKSGTLDTFKTLVLGPASLGGGAKRFEDSATLSDAVAGDVNGIGFIGLPYVRNAKALAVEDRGAQSMFPNMMAVATEDYPLSRRLYLYIPANPKAAYTRKFIEFAISTAGQDIVGANGFIAQNVRQEKQTVAPGAPSEYKRLTDGAQRLSLDFRFRSGRSDLDEKARADLDRVISFVRDLHYSGSNVMLFGFADSAGTLKVNQTLSENRAHAVEQEFKQKGLNLGIVKGFGSDSPVASNDTDAGREKNRRVEIWVKK
jgi:phosphate transport system substrate-binding protein